MGRNPAQRFRSPDGEQNRKIFLTFFNRPLAKIFSIKETKIFLFCLPANAGTAETLSHPQTTGRAGKNSFPPDPLFFLPARHARFAGESMIFMPALLAFSIFRLTDFARKINKVIKPVLFVIFQNFRYPSPRFKQQFCIYCKSVV